MTIRNDSPTVLIADDHTLLRETLRACLEEEGIAVVGEAGDGDRAVELAGRLQPDVVLMDVQMPGEGGVVAWVRRLGEVAPRSRIVILTMHDDSALVARLLDCGVHGFLVKSVSRMELVWALRGIAASGERLIISVPHRSQPYAGDAGSSERLSRRERDVLELVAQGFSNAHVAARLKIAEGTVKRHLFNIFTKLGAESRIDAVNKARVKGMISLSSERRFAI